MAAIAVKGEGRIKVVFYVLTAVLLLASALLSAFYFASVFSRIIQSIRDLGLSIAYYFTELMGFYDRITPTVNEIPAGAIEILPFDPTVFQAKLEAFGELLVSKENVEEYLSALGDSALTISRWIVLLAPIAVLLWIILKLKPQKINNDYNVDTKMLKAFKRLEDMTWRKLKTFVLEYVAFLSVRRKYVVFFGLIWAYNLNAFTIVIEFIAYVLYLSISMDIIHIYTQIAKLAMDLTIAIDFLPAVTWLIIGWFIFDGIRQSIGIAILRSYESFNRAFLLLHAGALFLTGKQRSKKTSIITDMALTQEQIFRDQALKGMLKREKQFPYFPWINVELAYKSGRAQRKLPTLESCRRLVRALKYHFYRNVEAPYSEEIRRNVFRRLKKKYGYEFSDFIFHYDYERYALSHNDGLTMVSVFEAIEGYIQQYYIYAAPTSLIFGNYATRTDIVWEDYGNFPKYDGDFFDRRPEEITEISSYSHIFDWDSARLGILVEKGNSNKDGLEVGCITIAEIAKERGNQITNHGIKADDKESNVKNDLVELNIKMLGHSATIDNYTYIRWLFDDQRPDSLGADNKDLCDIIMIKETSDAKMVLPFYAVEELVGLWARSFYDKHYVDNRVCRGDNTLPGYLLKKLFMPIFNHCERLENKYSVYTAKLKVWDGMTNEEFKGANKYYIMTKKTYSKRFATDGIKDFYAKKAGRSKIGLNDYACFKSERMTVAEMNKMHSQFYMKLNRVFKQEGEQQGKKSA